MNTRPSTILFMLATAALAAALPSQGADEAGDIIVGDSDTEIKAIKARLKDIRNVLTALPRTVTAPGLGAQLLEAQKSFKAAEESFKSGTWTVAINEAKTFLDLTQKPDHKTWLRAQFILGRSLEETGQSSKATKIYLNYLATLSTSTDQRPEELTEVLARLVRIKTKNSQASDADLSKFLSSIVAVNRPLEISDQMKYHTGVASSNIGKTALALSWLDGAESEAMTAETRAQSKYFKALIAIHAQNWQMASEQLEGVIKIEAINPNLKNTAHLTLARVLIKQKKPILALENYDQVSATSDSHRDANFEKILLLIRLDRSEDALKASRQWLAKHPNHQDATQIGALINWLDLKAGNLDAAKSSIEKTQQLLATIRSEIKNSFLGPKFTREDAERLERLTRGQISAVKDLDDIRSMFTQLDSLADRLAEVDGLERGLIFSLARSDLKHFRPALANQLAQYDTLADETLQAGLKILYFDRIRLEKRLTDSDRQKLDANERRRAGLFGKYERFKRHWQRWGSWAAPVEQIAKLAKSWERMDLIAGKNAATGLVSENDPEANSINDRISNARKEMLQTLHSLQKARAANLTNESDLTDSLAIFEAYHALVAEDMERLAVYTPTAAITSEKLDDADARDARLEWGYTSNILKKNMKLLKIKARDDLGAFLSDLEHAERVKTQLSTDIEQMRGTLGDYLSERFPAIISRIDYAIGQRMGRQLKWAGDLEYLKYADSTNAQDAARRKHELENQILSDEIRDYGQRRPK